MKKSLVFWVEEYFYSPKIAQKLLSLFLSPLSYLYCFIMYLRFKSKKAQDFGIPIISVGNLNVGGSGKTPLVTALASRYDNAAIILRGYGRDSKGLYIIKTQADILEDVSISGDEAMIYARKLPNAVVIVSEDRKEGILKAKALGAKIIFLDDAYSKHDIQKLDILIEVKSANNFCLPSGPFREKLWQSKAAIVLKDGLDFERVVEIKDRCAKMSLLTAIARPSRLDKYLPKVVSKNCFADHHAFVKSELEEILQRDGVDSLLVTYKDFVKVESFGLPLSLMDLEVKVDPRVFEIIGNYIESKN